MKEKAWYGFRSLFPADGDPSMSLSLSFFTTEERVKAEQWNLAAIAKIEDSKFVDLLQSAGKELKSAEAMVYEGDPDDDFDAYLDEYVGKTGREIRYYIGYLKINLIRKDRLPKDISRIPPKELEMLKQMAASSPKPALELEAHFTNAPEIKRLMDYIRDNYLAYNEVEKLFA